MKADPARAGSLRLFAVAVATLSACMLTEAAWYDVPGINGRQITLYGKPFFARGVCYSPVPINESMLFGPYGDYFTDEYAFLWRRDLPLIRAMGANSIRIYGWDDSADHTLFLNYVVEQGLRVLITFPLGSASSTPVRGDANRKKVVDRFAAQVGKYGEHSAILAWSFGNEINMMEHGFLQEFDREFVCGWNVHEESKGGCYNPAHPPNASNPCFDSSYCVYDKLFRWIEQAAFAAHQKAMTPILSTFADTDLVLDKIQRVGHMCPSVNIWAVQLYRGYSFGPWFEQAQNASNSPTNFKPFLVTEYGVDAYHDVCGHDPLQTPCFNQLGDSSGSHEDEGTQALYNRNLTIELGWHSSAQPQCNLNSAMAQELRDLTGDDSYLNSTCVSAGGFVYSWVDEYWKGSHVAAECTPNFWEPAFTLDTCGYKAHVTCPNWNASLQDLCGQPLFSSPDHYQNEEWFGLTSPTKCADSMDSLRLRKAYWALREEWTDGLRGDAIETPSCRRVTSCPGECSGRGKCETDHRVCGPATAKPNSGAPCCICDPGWAGLQCDELDARTQLSLVAGFGILALISAVLLSYGLRAVCMRKFNPMPQYGTTGSGIEQGLLLDHKLLASGGVSQYGSLGKSVK